MVYHNTFLCHKDILPRSVIWKSGDLYKLLMQVRLRVLMFVLL